MKIELLPSTIIDGRVANRQHLSCFVVDDLVAIDAGSLSMASSSLQKERVRDIVLTHAHIDHIAGLPLFIDDLFSTLKRPVVVHAAEEVIDVLKTHIFNWQVYPDFAELENENGPVLEYMAIEAGSDFYIEHLSLTPVPVNHKVPSFGFIISSGEKKLAISGDTAEMDSFWESINSESDVSAIFIECAFPNELEELAIASHHMTPRRLNTELARIGALRIPIYAINLKPMFKDQIRAQLEELGDERIRVLDVNRPAVIE